MHAVSYDSYVRENQAATVSANKSDLDLKSVLRAFNGKDHFYTTNGSEVKAGFEKIAFYCAANLNDYGATKPFYRFLLNGFDHFYTVNIDEGFAAAANDKGIYEGILCYTW